MFITITNQKNGFETHVRADEICAIGEVKSADPIFIGSFIGLKNGQSFTATQKAKKVREWVEKALQNPDETRE